MSADVSPQLPIFVISLADAEQRRSRIVEQMQALDLSFTFVDAVDGHRLTPEQEALVDREWWRRRRGDRLRPAEIGCALSHALLYRRLVEERVEQAIVLEDDARLTPMFAEFARGGFPLPEAVGVVVLHCYRNQFARHDGGRDIAHGHRLYRPFGRLLGTCAYYVTRASASALYDAAVPIWRQADWPLPIADTLGARGLEPPIVHHDDGLPSTIQLFADRRIPLSIRLGRLLVFPAFVAPGTYGSQWKSKYAWDALFWKARAALFARRPATSSRAAE